MSQLITFAIITILLLAFDLYCYKAILAVYQNWSLNTQKKFKFGYWGYTLLLIIGVFCSVKLGNNFGCLRLSN